MDGQTMILQDPKLDIVKDTFNTKRYKFQKMIFNKKRAIFENKLTELTRKKSSFKSLDFRTTRVYHSHNLKKSFRSYNFIVKG